MLNVVAVSGRMVERKLSERGGRGKIEGSEIARISRIFGFYAFLGIDTSAMEERGFYTAVPSIDVQRERERERFLIAASLFHRYRSKTIYGWEESRLFYSLLRLGQVGFCLMESVLEGKMLTFRTVFLISFVDE